MINDTIHIRLRLVIIKEGRLLTSYTKKHNFYFYIGRHMEYGETIIEGCKREIAEECGEGTEFTFKKILYVQDFFDTRKNEQNVELFILGNINKYDGLEHKSDAQHADGLMWLSWLDMNNLPDNLYPASLTKRMLSDYKNNFPKGALYL